MARTFPLKFGDAGQYELSEEALRHILRGDTVVRPVNTPEGRIQETVLAGGLHTYAGWEAFVAPHPKVVHLLQFQVGVHDAWHYARELQNGVITLKIPKRLFNKGGANITMQPDNYYKSGYLWKTLFPRNYSEEEILKVVGEALLNIDREDSKPPTAEQPAGVLYGYAAVHDPFTAIKIRIQVRDNQIMSAFPAWEQPRTGNNGKAYSHAHSISFQIAESTLDHEKFKLAYGPTFPNQSFDLEAFLRSTPQFIKARALRNPDDDVDASRAARLKVLDEYAGNATGEDLDVIDAYLADYPCAKDPFSVQRCIYDHAPRLLDESPIVFNAAQVTENIGECLWVLASCDRRFGSRRAVDAMTRFLGMAIVHTGGLNTLMFKRLLTGMISIAVGHHDASALRDVCAALATSPCRAALYTEFDLNPFVKKNDEMGLMIIGLPVIELELNTEHLLEFIAFNMGENYLLHFNKEQRIAIARKSLEVFNQGRMVKDVMARFVGSDFDFFMADRLDPSKLTTQKPPAEDDLIAIMRDYGRMMVMLRQRIVLEDRQAYATEPDYSQTGTQAHFELIRQKHKYKLVRAMHDAMLEGVKAYAEKIGYVKLSSASQAAMDRLPTECIPLPKPIPTYIDSWRSKSMPGNKSDELTIDEIVGPPPSQGL